MRPPDPVYLDNNASTPLDPRVFEAMVDALARGGNPSSGHAYGLRANAAVERARAQVAALLHADPAEVVFTGGATEANNLALKGLPAGGSVVTCATEHPSVLAPLESMRRAGLEVRVVGVGPDGVVDLAALAAAVDASTRLVSVMAVNNETGVVAPLAEIAEIAGRVGALVHSDATQAMAWGGLDAATLGLDLVSLSAHKFHGPQGTGALLVRGRARGLLRPLLEGGGQERGLRSGTHNVAGIVGTGEAAVLAQVEGAAAAPAVAARRDRLGALLAACGGVTVNGAPTAPGTLNIAVAGVLAGVLAAAVPTVAFSAGSACHAAGAQSSEAKPSPVLLAMGLSSELAAGSVRLSLSRHTTDAEVAAVGAALAEAIRALRSAI